MGDFGGTGQPHAHPHPHPNSDDEEEEGEDEQQDPQTFFAGGGERRFVWTKSNVIHRFDIMCLVVFPSKVLAGEEIALSPVVMS